MAMKKILFVLLCCLWAPLTALAQLPVGQIPQGPLNKTEESSSPLKILKLEMPTEPIENYSYFNIDFTIQTNSPWTVMIEGYEKIEGAYLSRHPRVYTLDWTQRIYRMRITYRANQMGYFYVGGFKVKTKEGEYRTEKRLLQIGMRRRGQVEVPIELSWRVKDNYHFQKEAFPVYLQATDSPYPNLRQGKFDLRYQNKYFSFSELPIPEDKSQIVERKEGPITLYSYVVACFLVSYDAAGELVLPRGQYTVADHWAEVYESPIKIIPYEGEKKEQSLIGNNLQYQAALSDFQIHEGDVPKLFVMLSGVGNLNFPISVEPISDELKFINRHVDINVQPTINGYKGIQTISWEIPNADCGTYEIILPKLGCMDLAKKENQNLKGVTLTLSVYPKRTPLVQETADVSFLPATVQEMLHDDSEEMHKQFENYLLYLPGTFFLVLAIIIYLIKRKRLGKEINLHIVFMAVFMFSFLMRGDVSQREILMAKALDSFEAEDYTNAQKELEMLLSENKNNASVLYNLSLTSYKLEKRGDAIYYARQAIYNEPLRKEYRTWINNLENEYELHYQFPLVPRMSLDLSLIVNLVLFNVVMLIILIFSIVGMNKRFWNVSILLISILIAFHIGSGVVFWQREANVAVVRLEDKALLKMHKVESDPIYQVPAGTTVKILGDYQDFYMVRTSMDFMGWIEKESLRLPQ